MSYRILIPAALADGGAEGDTGYTPVDTASNLDDAIAKAKARIIDTKARADARVELADDDATEVWSVQWRPERPTIEGHDADYAPILNWGVEWRVVHDPTYVTETFPVLNAKGKVVDKLTEPTGETAAPIGAEVVGSRTIYDDGGEG